MTNATMQLETLPLSGARVGYGQLGLHGELGYEGQRVQVGGKPYKHAISSHPPAHVAFRLERRFARFRCLVALNDDVPAGVTYADFSVFADGRLVAAAHAVQSGERPRELVADVSGAVTLELRVATTRWAHCHAVWLDPELDEAAPSEQGAFLDCLQRAEVLAHQKPPFRERCIATVVSPKYTGLLDDMLGSLRAHGGCHDAALVVFALDADAECLRIAAKYGAHVIPCRSHARVNATSKALMYSVARLVDADHYLCLDADMLVLSDLGPVFASLEAMPHGSILACREGNGHGLKDLAVAFKQAYWGTDAEARTLGLTKDDLAYSLVVNDGLFAGGRAALLALDAYIRELEQALAWVDARRDNWWRNQFVFNLALTRLKCGVELDGVWNVQLHVQDVEWRKQDGHSRAYWNDRAVRVLHFSGVGRNKYASVKPRFAHVPDPIQYEGAASDSYAKFLGALRTWIGHVGMQGLVWSFYGLANGAEARVADPSTFPLLATLHYLVRANGCTRVLETGTARGVSAACLASAVAHRPGACVVTFDPHHSPERDALWSLLPPRMSSCIQARQVGSHEGMASALARGEQYEAALLDSVHTEEHAFREFELATQLVCPGGLIIMHDATYAHGTVDRALERIQAAGYDVTRLWGAERGVREDDGLGLAVIENRRSARRLGQGADSPSVAVVAE